MAEFSPSVVRAVFMIIIHILSKYLHRRYDLLSSICFSALLMMIYNPFYIFNLGFQLSYLAVLSLAFALPLIESRISKLEEGDAHKWAVKALRIISPIFVIQLAMAPITAFHFFYFSFASFVINIPVIALAGIILPLSVVLILVSICLGDGFFFGLGATAADLLLEIMVGLNEYTGSLSLSSVDVTAPSTLALGMFYGFFFFFFSEEFWRLCRKGDNKKIAGFIICILCLSLCLPTIVGENQRKADIVFVDVGQGDCIHLRTPGGKNVLIDGGGSRDYDIGKKVLLPYMLKNGVKKIDLALVTHLHEDHYGGISSVCRLMTVDKLALYTANIFKENQIKNETGIKEESLVYLAAGDRITVEKDIYIDIIYPKKLSNEEYKELATLENDENLSSLVLKIYFNGTSVLVTGDMGFAGEEYILKEYGGDKNDILKSDILKVGHHGSKYSTSNAFLESVRPQAAVIQVGKNNFGHPHGDVIEKLAEKDIMIYRNDEDGAVLINIKRDSVRINSML
jgi:competence protein ComEC